MSNLKRPLYLSPDDYHPVGFPQGTARPVRRGSPLRRPRRVRVNEAWLRRRSLARRAWRRRAKPLEALGALLIIVPGVSFYGWALWQAGSVVLDWLIHVHITY